NRAQKRHAVEVAVVGIANREPEEHPQDCPVRPTDELPVEAVVRPRSGKSGHDVRAGSRLQVAADRLGLHGQVRRREQKELAAAGIDGRGQRRSDAEIPGVMDRAHARIAGGRRVGQLSGAVAAPVVHDHDLKGDAETLQGGDEPFQRPGQLFGFVEGGHSDRKERRALSQAVCPSNAQRVAFPARIETMRSFLRSAGAAVAGSARRVISDLRSSPSLRWETAAFAGALLVYAITRFWRLADYPISFFGDEAYQPVAAEALLHLGFGRGGGRLSPMSF